MWLTKKLANILGYNYLNKYRHMRIACKISIYFICILPLLSGCFMIDIDNNNDRLSVVHTMPRGNVVSLKQFDHRGQFYYPNILSNENLPSHVLVMENNIIKNLDFKMDYNDFCVAINSINNSKYKILCTKNQIQPSLYLREPEKDQQSINYYLLDNEGKNSILNKNGTNLGYVSKQNVYYGYDNTRNIIWSCDLNKADQENVACKTVNMNGINWFKNSSTNTVKLGLNLQNNNQIIYYGLEDNVLKVFFFDMLSGVMQAPKVFEYANFNINYNAIENILVQSANSLRIFTYVNDKKTIKKIYNCTISNNITCNTPLSINLELLDFSSSDLRPSMIGNNMYFALDVLNNANDKYTKILNIQD